MTAWFLLIDPLNPVLALDSAVGSVPSVNTRSALFAALAFLVMCLLAACASSPEEGVVTDKPGAGAEPLPFQRPTFNPGTNGMSSGHSGF